MNTYTAILPGARIRTTDGVIGTVERLEAVGTGPGDQPDHMIVRSEDGQWRYRIPLMLVTSVTQEAFSAVVHITMEPRDLPHYIMEEQRGSAATAPPVSATATPMSATDEQWAAGADEETLRIPLAAEELIAQKQAVVRGNVHVHKGVETVEQSFTVPVYHEEAIVEHISPDEYDGRAPTNPNETIIPIVEEQLVVEKRSVVKEYIRVRKNIVTEQQDVHDTVRREFVEVTEQTLDGAGNGARPLPLLREEQGSAL